MSYDEWGNLQQSYSLINGQWVTRNNYYGAFGRLQSSTVTNNNGTTPVNVTYDGFNVLDAYNASSCILSLLGQGA